MLVKFENVRSRYLLQVYIYLYTLQISHLEHVIINIVDDNVVNKYNKLLIVVNKYNEVISS